MHFTLTFFKVMFLAVAVASPILVALFLIIVLLGLVVGRKEGWKPFDAVYWALITATTVGYGDIRPSRPLSRVLSIAIAILGLTFTGIIVAMGVYSASVALEDHIGMKAFRRNLENITHEP